MGKGESAKRKSKSGKLKDLTLKARQGAAVRGGVSSSGNEAGTLKRGAQ